MEFGTAVWSSDRWRAQAEAWLGDRLAVAGVRPVGPVTHPHIRPWATVLRVPTDAGVIWMKATGPETAFEVRLYSIMTALVPDHVLHPLASDPRRGWIVLPDGGPIMGERLEGAALGSALGAALVQYARLQVALARGVDEMLMAGIPDMRPAAMPREFDRALEVTAATIARSDGDADRMTHAHVTELRDTVAGWCGRLSASRLPASLDHNDLHPWNIFDDGTGPARFFDWGDSVVAHPFAATLVPLGQVQSLLGVEFDHPEFVAIRDSYLDVFSGMAPGEDLVETLEIACRVAKIARALTWERAVGAAREQGDKLADRYSRAPLATLGSIRDTSYLSVG